LPESPFFIAYALNLSDIPFLSFAFYVFLYFFYFQLITFFNSDKQYVNCNKCAKLLSAAKVYHTIPYVADNFSLAKIKKLIIADTAKLSLHQNVKQRELGY